ncbi:hypothetical protein [Novosphingobium sp.]|uniref:hypothetical protein n=1 Tax=Novosphingobium sp. TaxID=1874826 RepID=UPI00286D71FF|nr:hypothetical protein [Novosphingobium sp.]
MTEFTRLTEKDLRSIELQESQKTVLGMPGGVSDEALPHYLAAPQAWACRVATRDGGARLIACFGVVEQIAGRQGVAWALLAKGLGHAHVALTRRARAAVADSGLPRVEALVRAPDIEALLADRPWLDAGQRVSLALATPTPEMRWAETVGLTPAHLLRRFGPSGETVMLYERFA